MTSLCGDGHCFRVLLRECPSELRVTWWNRVSHHSSSWGLLGCDRGPCCFHQYHFFPSQFHFPEDGGYRRLHGPLKRWHLTTTLHGVITEKTSTWIITTVKASNLASITVSNTKPKSAIRHDSEPVQSFSPQDLFPWDPILILPSHLFRFPKFRTYEGVSKSFRTGRLERELQMVQLSATGWSCIAILWVSLVSFAAITICVASQRVFIVVYFVMTQSGNFWIHPRTYRWQG
jgi:hypothetical protein